MKGRFLLLHMHGASFSSSLQDAFQDTASSAITDEILRQIAAE